MGLCALAPLQFLEGEGSDYKKKREAKQTRTQESSQQPRANMEAADNSKSFFFKLVLIWFVTLFGVLSDLKGFSLLGSISTYALWRGGAGLVFGHTSNVR